MGNNRNRRSRRHETPSPDRDLSEAQVETPMQGNETLTNVSTVSENEDRSNLIDPRQISNEIQVWTENFEQKNNDRIMKMREEMENKFDALLKEIRTNKQQQHYQIPDLKLTENKFPNLRDPKV